MANPYTKEDDERLLRYIATYNPERPGRSGNKLYQDLVDQPKKWPWSKRHPWSSWRERYVKKSKEFDKKISDWQKKQGDRPGTLTHLKRSSQQEKSSASRPAAKTANGASSPSASRTVKATINDNGKRGRSSVGQSNSQTLKRPRLQTISPVQKEAGTIRPAAIKKKPAATTTASKGKGKEKAPPVSDSETESESEGPAGPDDYNYKGQVFEKEEEEEEEEEEHPPQAMEADEEAAESGARSQSIWDDNHRASSSPEPVAGSHLVSPTVPTHPAQVLEVPATTATPSRPIASIAQTNRPVTPKPDGDEGLQISQEPTPPRSGVSETPQGSPASSRKGRFDVNTPHSERSAKRMRVTELPSVALEHLNVISVHGSSSPTVETPTKVPSRRRSFFKVRPIEPEDIFETASSNGTPAAAPPRKQREPPRLIEGPYVSSFADSSGASRLTAGGRRTNGASDQSDESESEAVQRRPDPNWPPRRGSMKSVTDAKLGGKGVSPKATAAADTTAVSRVSSSSKDGASVQRAPAVPAMKHVLEKGPTRAIFPRPPQVNAEASSSKIKLPGPSKPAIRTASPSDASSTNQPVRFPRVTASKSSAAPAPRPSSLAPAKDPFSKDFIRTDTESDGLAKAAVEKGKVKAKLMIERRQTFSGVPPHDGVPHLDLANYVRKREHQRTNGRQSAPLIDLRARRASSAASRSRSRSRSSASSSAHRPRRNSSASASSIDHRSRRASSIASVAPTLDADMRRLSAAPHDMRLVVLESLEGVLQRLAKNHGFDEAVARRIWECKGDFRKTDKALRVMREWAQEGLDQLGDAGQEGDEGDEDGEEEGEDEQEQDAEAEEEADVAMLVAPSRSASDRSASPAQRAPVIPRTSVSPVRASNGFAYTPRPEPEPEPRPAHYSPPSRTRAGQFVRLERAGRAEEARLREIRRASRGYEIGTRESDAEGEEAAQEGGDVEMDDDEAEEDGWDAEDAVRELEEQEQRAREEQEREQREERERAVAEQERLRREMEKAAERRAEKARRAQERRAAAEREQLREAEQRERAESEQRQRLERGRSERARMERERLERAQVERERMERERMERQQREREQEERMERERLEREQRERMERERAQRAQREREEAQRRDREEQPEVAESIADVEPSVEEMDLDRETDIHEERVQPPTHEQYFGDEDSDEDVGEKEDYLPGPPHPSSPLVQESQQSGESSQGRDGVPKPQRTEEDYFTLFNGDATKLRALADRIGPRSVKWQIADAYVEMAGN